MLSSQLFCMCRCRYNFLKAPSRASKVQISFLMCLCCCHYPEIQERRLMRFANFSVLLTCIASFLTCSENSLLLQDDLHKNWHTSDALTVFAFLLIALNVFLTKLFTALCYVLPQPALSSSPEPTPSIIFSMPQQ